MNLQVEAQRAPRLGAGRRGQPVGHLALQHDRGVVEQRRRLLPLEQALPGRVTGSHFGTYSSVGFVGKRPDGRPFHGQDSGFGGWGACAAASSLR